MRDNTQEKSLITVNENSIFYKIKNFFRNLFYKHKAIENSTIIENGIISALWPILIFLPPTILAPYPIYKSFLYGILKIIQLKRVRNNLISFFIDFYFKYWAILLYIAFSVWTL